jgi:hypothetical protein
VRPESEYFAILGMIVAPMRYGTFAGISIVNNMILWFRSHCRYLVLVLIKMPSHGREIAYELRCCIICLRIALPPPHNEFSRIGVLLKLKTRTVQRIWQRARDRAGSDDLREILACVGSLERSGRPPRIQDGTQESAALRTLILQLDDCQLNEIAQI